MGASATLDRQAEDVFFEILASPADKEPFAEYRWLHQAAPVFATSAGLIVFCRYADAEEALRHRDLGRGEESVQHLTDLPAHLLDPVMALWKRTMVFANPPLHTRIRRPIASAFTPRHVQELRAAVRARCLQLLNAQADDPMADFVQTVGSPLGSNVVGDLLGVPEADRPWLAKVSPDSMKVFDPLTAKADLPAAAEAAIGMADYFRDLLAQRRQTPTNDLTSRLVNAPAEDQIEEIEMVAAVANLMNAGSDTAVNLLCNSLHWLMVNPAQLALLFDDPGLIPSAVEELARFDPPLNMNPRTAMTATSVAGIDMAPGQIVICLQGAANRDPAQFTDPDALDLRRDQGPSLSFGGGAHYCLGAHLGRLVVAEFLSVLVTNFASVTPAALARRRPGHNLRGFIHMPVTLSR